MKMRKPPPSEITRDLAAQFEDLLADVDKFRKSLFDLIIDLEDLSRMTANIEENERAGD
jgi:hypothetical protein